MKKVKVIKSTTDEVLIENENDTIIDEQTEEEVLPQADFSEDYKARFLTTVIPHTAYLQKFAMTFVKNIMDSEDLVQETLARAYRFFNNFQDGTNCRAWLTTILKNLYFNEYRKIKKEGEKIYLDDIYNSSSILDKEESGVDNAEAKYYSQLLDDEMVGALNNIKENFKVVIILCDLEGLSYEEIADFLKCPVGTVRSRIHRARKLLHRKLLPYAKKRGYVTTNAA